MTVVVETPAIALIADARPLGLGAWLATVAGPAIIRTPVESDRHRDNPPVTLPALAGTLFFREELGHAPPRIRRR